MLIEAGSWVLVIIRSSLLVIATEKIWFVREDIEKGKRRMAHNAMEWAGTLIQSAQGPLEVIKGFGETWGPTCLGASVLLLLIVVIAARRGEKRIKGFLAGTTQDVQVAADWIKVRTPWIKGLMVMGAAMCAGTFVESLKGRFGGTLIGGLQLMAVLVGLVGACWFATVIWPILRFIGNLPCWVHAICTIAIGPILYAAGFHYEYRINPGSMGYGLGVVVFFVGLVFIIGGIVQLVFGKEAWNPDFEG